MVASLPCKDTLSCWYRVGSPAENTSLQCRISFLLAAVSFPSSCRGRQSPTVQTAVIKIPDYEKLLILCSTHPLQKKAKHIQVKKKKLESANATISHFNSAIKPVCKLSFPAQYPKDSPFVFNLFYFRLFSNL